MVARERAPPGKLEPAPSDLRDLRSIVIRCGHSLGIDRVAKVRPKVAPTWKPDQWSRESRPRSAPKARADFPSGPRSERVSESQGIRNRVRTPLCETDVPTLSGAPTRAGESPNSTRPEAVKSAFPRPRPRNFFGLLRCDSRWSTPWVATAGRPTAAWTGPRAQLEKTSSKPSFSTGWRGSWSSTASKPVPASAASTLRRSSSESARKTACSCCRL